jgi:hypothetical protein
MVNLNIKKILNDAKTPRTNAVPFHYYRGGRCQLRDFLKYECKVEFKKHLRTSDFGFFTFNSFEDRDCFVEESKRHDVKFIEAGTSETLDHDIWALV